MLPEESITKIEFADATVGMNIPKSFIPAIEKVSMLQERPCSCDKLDSVFIKMFGLQYLLKLL